MEHTEDEKGTAIVLLQRLAKERVPRLQEIKANVDRGDCLTAFDIEYLEHALDDANKNRLRAAQFPEYNDIVAQVAQLYQEITSKALENERGNRV